MSTIRLNDLLEYRFPIAEVVIRAVDPMIYLVFVQPVAHEPSLRVVDAAGDSVVFRSVEASRQALAGLNIASAWLEHQSSYDEMIGVSGGPDQHQLRVAISIPAERQSSP